MTLDIKEYEKIQKHCKEVAIRKNANYGCDGLRKFGLKGMIIRMSHKMDRLVNLGYNNEKDLNQESIEDTCLDLVNYAIYCVMLQRKKLEASNSKEK